jgi:hypothetical protein
MWRGTGEEERRGEWWGNGKSGFCVKIRDENFDWCGKGWMDDIALIL